MLPHKVRLLTISLLLPLATLLLAGCFLRNMFGNAIIVEDIPNEVNEILNTVFSDSSAAVCLDSNYGFYECTYIVDGEIITSTLYLLSEYGLTGVLLDPLVLQVPNDVISVTAIFTATGGSPQPAVMSVRQAFEIRHTQSITAELGTKFLIFEFPPSVVSTITATNPISGPEFDFAFSFVQRQPISQTVEPVSIKMMATAKVVTRGHTYYAPVFPCVTSFTDVPSLTIPITTNLVNLQTSLGDLIRLGNALPCNHKSYDYTNTPPPDQWTFLPIVLR